MASASKIRGNCQWGFGMKVWGGKNNKHRTLTKHTALPFLVSLVFRAINISIPFSSQDWRHSNLKTIKQIDDINQQHIVDLGSCWRQYNIVPTLHVMLFKKGFTALPGLVSQVDVTVSDEGVSHPLRTSISQLEYLGSTRNLPGYGHGWLGMWRAKNQRYVVLHLGEKYSFFDLFKPLQKETRTLFEHLRISM